MSKIVITEFMDETFLPNLRERHEVIYEPELVDREDQLYALLHDTGGLIVRNRTSVGRALLDNAPNLSAIGRLGVGLDNIDITLCKERGTGNIVCISSVAGLRARSKLISYSISKSAVIGLVRSCAAAFGPAVRVNGIAPGLIQTDMTKASMDLPLQESIKQETFLKTIGVPENISDAVLFLLSSRANFISGQTLSVDGGRVTVP